MQVLFAKRRFGFANRNGGRHCCQPPLRRAKDLPVFALGSNARRFPNPLSILAHQLRRRFLSGIPLFREALLTYPATWPEGSLVVRSAWPGKDRDPNQNRPMFHGPSWETPYRVPLRSPDPLSPRGGRQPGSRVARQEDFSSGASSRLAPERTRKSTPIACRRRSVLLSRSRPFRSCRFSGETGTSAPITPAPCTWPPSRKSEKYHSRPVDNGDIGNNRGTFPQRLKSPCFSCRFVPPALPRDRA